jgi:hypothetical protein
MFNILHSTGTIVTPAVTQAMNTIASGLLELVLSTLVALVAWAVNTWRAHLNNVVVKALADRLVRYVEARIPDNGDKYQTVAAEISKQYPRLSQDTIAHYIEAAVADFKSQINNKTIPTFASITTSSGADATINLTVPTSTSTPVPAPATPETGAGPGA